MPSGSIAPYSLGELQLRCHNSAAVSCAISIAYENLTMQAPGEQSQSGTYGMTGTYASTSEGGFSWDVSPYTGANTPPLLPLVPGWNELLFTFTSDQTTTTFFDAVVINQVQKRTH